MPVISRFIAAAVILCAAFIPAAGASSARAAVAKRYAVIIVLDGSRPDYFHLAKMPNLRRLIGRGVTYSQAFAGQEIANTPPSHATIGTGVFPGHHGIEGFFWKDPRTNQETAPTDNSLTDKGALEAVIRSHHVPSIASRLKGADPNARIVSVSGHKCYAADAMGTAAADYILCGVIVHGKWVPHAVGTHRPPPGVLNNRAWYVRVPPPSAGFAPTVEQWKAGQENDWTMRYAMWAFHRVHYPRLLMINLPETDVLGHYSRSTGSIRLLMRRFDRWLGIMIDAYRKAGILNRTDFIVTADHGMTRVSTTVPYNWLSNSIRATGAAQVTLEADTAASIGIAHPNMAYPTAIKIAQRGGKLVDAVLYKTHQQNRWQYRFAAFRTKLPLEVRKTYLALANTSASDSGPDVLAFYAPHVSTRHALFVGRYQWVAGHLGPQWEDQHIPLIIAGAGVRSGVTSSYPARLIDIAPTVEHLLGLKDAGVDGSVLDDALQHPTAPGKASQARRARTLLPMVKALQAREKRRYY